MYRRLLLISVAAMPATASALDWNAPDSVLLGDEYYVEAYHDCYGYTVDLTIYKDGSFFAWGSEWDYVTVGEYATDYQTGTVEFSAYIIDCQGDGWGDTTALVTISDPSPDSITIGMSTTSLLAGQSLRLSSSAHDVGGDLDQHMFWRRGPRTTNTFSQDENGWESYTEAPTGWSAWVPGTPGQPSGTTNSTIGATFTVPKTSPGYWQFRANARDSSGHWGTYAKSDVLYATAIQDADNDGMSDAWESSFGLNPAYSGDANLDNDFDGVTNLQEYVAITNPTVCDLPPALPWDVDGDGMSDVFGEEHSLPLGSGAQDADGDGFTNLQESIAGTDPNDPASFFGASAQAWSNGSSFSVKWSSVNGKRYQIERSDDGNSWVGVGGFILGTGSQLTFADSGPVPATRYFRVRIVPSLDSDGDGFDDWEELLLGTSPTQRDGDGDGLPDAWEVLYFGSTTATTSGADPDNDTVTNIDEYHVQTDPTYDDHLGGRTFAYDAVGRLTSASSGSVSIEFVLDAEGNITATH